MIQIAKQNLDLVSIVEAAGVELKQSGARYVGLCPFHNEKTPSFFVFPDNRFKCFGCGAYGNTIDLVKKLYGLSFPDALKHLGIEQGRITPEMKRNIEKQKRKTELLNKFNKWVSEYLGYLGTMINRTQKLLKSITPEDLELYAPLLHGLPVWEHYSDILIHGNDDQKFKLYKEARKCRKKNST